MTSPKLEPVLLGLLYQPSTTPFIVMDSSAPCHVLPDQLLLLALSFLPPASLGRCACVSIHWRDIAGSTALWRPLCRIAVDLYHPRPPRPPPGAEADGTRDDAISLSTAHQEALNARRAAEVLAADEAFRRSQLRAEVVAALRVRIASGGFQRSFPGIPMVRTAGVYTLRHEYIRKGIRDMFHVYEGTLRVVYHRTLLFRPSGALLYSNLPGDYTESFKELRRTLMAEATADGAGVGGETSGGGGTSGSGGGGAASSARAGGVGSALAAAAAAPSLVGDVTPGMGSGGPRTSEAARGSWRLEGDLVVATVRCQHGVSLVWRCRLASADGGAHNRLVVESLHLIEGPVTAESSTPMTDVIGEELVWRPAAPIAALTGTARGAAFF